MNTNSAPARVRSLASWLVNQNSTTALHLVAARFAGVGAHRHHYSTLAALDEFGPASQATLGRRCGLDRSDMAACIAFLGERHLIERTADPLDRRRNVVRINGDGRGYLHRLDALVTEAQEEFLRPLSAAERRQLIGLLTRVAEYHSSDVEEAR